MHSGVYVSMQVHFRSCCCCIRNFPVVPPRETVVAVILAHRIVKKPQMTKTKVRRLTIIGSIAQGVWRSSRPDAAEIGNIEAAATIQAAAPGRDR